MTTLSSQENEDYAAVAYQHKAGCDRIASFRLLATLAVHGPGKSALGDHSAGSRRSAQRFARRASFDVRDVHYTHYGACAYQTLKG